MSRILLRKQRLIGRIAPDSGRIVELRGFIGVPARRAGRISSSSRFRLPQLEESSRSGPPACQLARARRERDVSRKVPPARFADPPLVVRMTRSLRGADLPEASHYMATPLR